MIIGSLLLIIAIAEFCLGIWFLTRYEKNQATMWYGLFAFAVATYVAGNGLGYLGWVNGQLGEHLAWTGGMLTAVFFLPFSYSFPLPRKKQNELIPWALWPALILISGLLWTGLFVQQQGVVKFGEGYSTVAGPYFNIMLAFFAIYWIWAVVNLLKAFGSSDGIHRWQIRMILTGLFISLVVSSVFDIYMPLTHITRYGYVGSLFSAVWFGFTSYIIVKK